MKEARLDNELERLYKKLPSLWESYGFRVEYFTRDYGMYYRGFIIGLENDVCRLVFEKETNSPVESVALRVGKKDAMFAPPYFSYFVDEGWYPLTGLTYWLSGIECERDKMWIKTWSTSASTCNSILINCLTSSDIPRSSMASWSIFAKSTKKVKSL